MEIIGYVFIASIILICISALCYKKAGKRLRKFILVYNGILYSVFIVLFAFGAVSDKKTEKLSKQYTLYSGTIMSGWYYEKQDNDYYFISSSYLFGSSNYAVPKSTCKLSPVAKITRSVKVFTVPDTNLYDDYNMEINGKSYILAENIVRIEPEFFDWIFGYTILGGLGIIIGNIVTVIIIIVNKRKEKKAKIMR